LAQLFARQTAKRNSALKYITYDLEDQKDNPMGTEISNVKSIKSHQNYLTEFDVKSLSAELNGSIGRFRNPNMAYSLSRSNTDLEAINEWLNSVGSRSPQTRRSYEKEAFRLLMWAVAEHQKPISSLDIQDMLEYEVFVKSLVSKYEGVTWMAAKIIQKVDTSSDSRDVVDEVYLKKRYARTDSQWRPFDKPLTPDGIEYAMRVLKSMFSFWTDIGYTVVNPLKLRKVVKKQDKRKSKDRVMSTATWDFLYEHMQKKVASTARSNEGRKETIAHLKALQAFMVFNSLYLLGVRISELSSLRMNSIFRRESTKREDRDWVKVLGNDAV
jgi:integrase